MTSYVSTLIDSIRFVIFAAGDPSFFFFSTTHGRRAKMVMFGSASHTKTIGFLPYLLNSTPR